MLAACNPANLSPIYTRTMPDRLGELLVSGFWSTKILRSDPIRDSKFFGELLKKLAPDTIHGIHRFLRKILADAVEWKYLPENPAKDVRLPPSRRREPPFLKPSQFRDLLTALAEPARTMVLVAMMTSMRIEEILGLRWGRVDLENGVLRVVETSY
jgi:integrase